MTGCYPYSVRFSEIGDRDKTLGAPTRMARFSRLPSPADGNMPAGHSLPEDGA
jgi:hypothetical protein